MLPKLAYFYPDFEGKWQNCIRVDNGRMIK